MNINELEALIQSGLEDENVEFKETLPSNRELAKWFVCFANAYGGKIIFGVDNDGEIIGIEKEKVDRILLQIDDVALRRCEPPVVIHYEVVEIDENRAVIVINIPDGNNKPYFVKDGRAYIRSGNRCRPATRYEHIRLAHLSRGINFDEVPIRGATFSDMDISYARDFFKKYYTLDLKSNENLKTVMRNLKLINEDEIPTLAGLLFFSELPQKFLPETTIITAHFPTEDVVVPPDDKKNIMGKVEDMLRDIERIFNIYIKESHEIVGFENEIRQEIPLSVLKESVVNAIAHRDYTVQAPIRVFIFPNRVEIHTPGGLPNTVTLEGMKLGIHVPRNPLIYSLLERMGLVTGVGRGIPSIIETMKKIGKEVELCLVKDKEMGIVSEFVLTLFRL